MNVEKININPRRKRILVSPLDWGLGHATRCIPLINKLQEEGAEVIIAASGSGYTVLKKEFPELQLFRIPGYNIRYSSNRLYFLTTLLLQLPRIATVIRQEHAWLKENLQSLRIDAVISDNRFGLSSGLVPCIYITHQLNIETGSSVLNKIAQRINYRFINKFQRCWIPDLSSAPGLAGKLSHPAVLPRIPIDYIGISSRIQRSSVERKDGLLIILSGPEPHRTVFEKQLMVQMDNHAGRITLIRGLPDEKTELNSDKPNIAIRNYAGAEELSGLIQKAQTIIARSGYSTVMDLYGINQHAVLIPTPGQTEQEYLARHLKKEGLFYTTHQANFNLEKEINNLNDFQFTAHTLPRELDRNVVSRWLKSFPQH